MYIHFVCRGNVFRSRMAEAFLASRKIKGLAVSSSGTVASETKFKNGPVAWTAMRIIDYNNLIPFMSFHARQTTKEMLEEADVVIFMEKKCYEYAIETLKANLKSYEEWDIPDFDDVGLNEGKISLQDDIRRIEFSQKDFLAIKERTDQLIVKII